MSELNSMVKKEIVYVDVNNNIEKAKAILQTVGNLRLVGETGVGKTTLVYKLSELLNMPLFEICLTEDTLRSDLLACDILEKGETKTRKGIVLSWLESSEGGILYIDGFNYARPNIISLLESLGDFRNSVFIPELNKTFKRTPKHKIVISYNPSEKMAYSGTFSENIATLRRFEGLELDYLPRDKEKEILRNITKNEQVISQLVEIAYQTRVAYQQGELKLPLTLGNLINYAKLYEYGLDLKTILCEIAISLYPSHERDKFLAIAKIE